MKKLLLSVLVAFFAFLPGYAAKVYFDNSKNWATISTWNFGTEGKTDVAGEVSQVNIDGHELYVAETEYAKIIFREGNDWGKGQTGNLDVEDGIVYNAENAKIAKVVDGVYTEVTDDTPTVYFDNTGTGWANVYGYSWSPDFNQELTTVEIDGHTLYAASLRNDEIIFRSSQSEWGNDKQTANLKVVDGAVYGASSLKSKGGSTDAIATIVNGSYNALGSDPYAKIYLLSSRHEFAQSADFKMATTDGKTYTLSVADADPDYTFKFFVIFTDGSYRYFSNGNDEIHNETMRISTDDTKNMSLHMGGNVTFTVTPYNNFEGIIVSIEGQDHPEENEFAPLYIVDEESGWNTKEANKLTTTDGKTYTITKENLTADYEFKFFGRDDHKHYFSNGLANLKNETEYILDINPALSNMSLDAGGASITFTLVLKEDHSSATLTITGQDVVEDEFPRMYLIGERTDNWSIKEKYRMTTTDGRTYTLTVPDMSTKSFRFCGDNTEVRNLGGAGADLTDGSYTLTAGTHAMTLAKGGEVTFTLVTDDDFATASLTIEGQGEIVPEDFKKMYLIGIDGWDIDKHKNEMTTTDGKIYTIEKYIPANKPFKFFGGAWQTREFTMKDGLGLEDGSYDVKPIPSENGEDFNLSLKESGNVLLTLEVTKDDFSEGKLTVKHINFEINPEDLPETLYLVGEVNENEWTPESAIAMTTQSAGIYTLEKAIIKGEVDNTGLFSFISKLGPWTDCGTRYGDAVGDGGKMIPDDNGVITGDILVANENAFEVENGTYDITVNLNTLKLTVTPVVIEEPDPTPIPPVEDETEYFLAGGFNNWSQSDNKFTKVEDDCYTISIAQLSGEFKITVGNWVDASWGTNGENITVGVPYVCYYGDDSTNIVLSDVVNNAVVTFVPSTNTITITGDIVENIEHDYVYHIHGSVNGIDWETYAMEKTNDNKWSFTTDNGFKNFVIKETDNAVDSHEAWIKSDGDGKIAAKGQFGAMKEGTDWESDLDGKCTYIFDPENMVLTVDGSTGINTIDAEEGDSVYFNLQGQRVANPEKGIYIRVVNGKAQKVMK